MTSKQALRGFEATTTCRHCGKDYVMSLVGMVRSRSCPHCGMEPLSAKIPDKEAAAANHAKNPT